MTPLDYWSTRTEPRRTPDWLKRLAVAACVVNLIGVAHIVAYAVRFSDAGWWVDYVTAITSILFLSSVRLWLCWRILNRYPTAALVALVLTSLAGFAYFLLMAGLLREWDSALEALVFNAVMEFCMSFIYARMVGGTRGSTSSAHAP